MWQERIFKDIHIFSVERILHVLNICLCTHLYMQHVGGRSADHEDVSLL